VVLHITIVHNAPKWRAHYLGLKCLLGARRPMYMEVGKPCPKKPLRAS